ncbi:hypothetical protein [Piscinibacter sp. HJYY11]|uniref:hypothetical protein n=1 Tax=Piscinibacter sp. HJYY11 TaxID=2801333 RepID=UPI001F2B68B0|nr:hypothetical protein [Piscinibacter sp. HJYY11]
MVALVALEPHEASIQSLTAATYPVLRLNRLRAMLGRQRANAAQGVLREVADFMSTRQRAGLPISELRPPFHGFSVGPTFVGRGFSLEQLLDAAVRSVTAFGSADEMIEEEEASAAPRHTLRTSGFLARLKRHLAGDNEDLRKRFERRLQLPGDTPEVTVDYAHERWLVQITSLPTTQRQAMNAQREAQSKLFELELARRAMDGNLVLPVLLLNEDGLNDAGTDESRAEGARMQERLVQLSKSFDTQLLHAASAEQGARLLFDLAPPSDRRFAVL